MLIKIALFVSSYSPLFAMLAIRFEQSQVALTCAALAVLGVAALYVVLHEDNRKARSPHKIQKVTDAGAQATGYLAGYLLPFLTVSMPSTRDLIAYILFLLVVATVYMRTSMIQINPLLLLFGWRVYEIEDNLGFCGYLIARRRVLAGDSVLTTRFSDEVLIHRAQATTKV
jgi:hypothetical protein